MRKLLGHWVVDSIYCLVAFYGLFALSYAQSPDGIGAGLAKASSYLFGGVVSSVASFFVVLVLVATVVINGKLGNKPGSHGVAIAMVTIVAIVLALVGAGIVSLSGGFGFLGVLAAGALFVGTAEVFRSSHPSLKGWFSGRFGGYSIVRNTPVTPTTSTPAPAAPAAASAAAAPVPPPAPAATSTGIPTP